MKAPVSIFRKTWFQTFVAFFFVQLAFIVMDVTGWVPKLRDLDGKFVGNLMDSFIVKEWFNFYHTAFFNLVTVFFVVVIICELSFTLLKSLIVKKSS